MKKSFLSVIIAISLIVTCFASPVLAKNAFPDVVSPDHDWAAEEINEMASLGIIKGYSDGTFKPNKTINKIEAMLLFARVAGFSNANYAKITEQAYNQYKFLLDEIDLGSFEGNKKEIAFLLNRGIFDEKKVVEYLGDDAYMDSFPRGDAAVMLTNLCGAAPKKAGSYTLDFADKKDISSDLSGYVAYVVEEGLMTGVQRDDGTVAFEADANMSRAQVSVILYRILENLQISVEAGVVDNINAEGRVIDFMNNDLEIKSYIIPEDATVKINGVPGEIEKVLVGSDIVVVRKDKEIMSVDFISPTTNATVKGTVEEIKIEKTFSKVSVAIEGTEDVRTFYIGGEIEVTSNGVADEIASIKKDDFVVVKLLGADVVSIDRQTASATVQGELQSVSLGSPVKLSVLTVDETSQEETLAEYTVAEDASVRLNGEKALLSSISVGDRVVLTVTRGNITKIVATSTKGSVTGTITSITIAPQSKVTLAVNSVETEYYLSMDAKYEVAGKTGTIYDLRLGNVVTLTLSGSTVTKIEQATETSSTTKTGIVEAVSTSYGYVQMTSTGATGAVSEQIFASRTGTSISVKVINGETGVSMQFRNIKKGDYIIAVGSYSNGAFVAKTIIVTPQ